MLLLTGVFAAVGLLVLPSGLAALVLFRPDLFEKRGGLRLAEIVFVAVAIGFGVTLWFAFVLAELGVFSIQALGALDAAIVIAGVARIAARRRRPDWARPALDVWDLGLGLLLLVLSFIYFHPAEYILGGLDPGVYVLTGVGIEKHGSIIQPDVETQRLLPEERATLFGQVPRPWIRSGMPGFTERDFVVGEMEPQGFHLYPTWLAVVAALSSPQKALYGTPALALLAVAALYFLGRRLLRPAVGLAGALIWGVDAAQIWFARTPSAEMLAEVLLLCGIYLLSLAMSTKSRFFAIMAGCALGMVHLAKIDLVALPIAILGTLALLWVWRRLSREFLLIAASYCAVCMHAALHAVVLAPAYTMGTIITLTSFFDFSALDQADPNRPYTPALLAHLIAVNSTKLLALSVMLALVAGVLILARRRRWSDRMPRLPAVRINLAIVVLALSLGFYGYYVRPVIEQPLPEWKPLADLIVSDRSSLVRLGWYLSPFGVLLGLAGLAALTISRPPLALAVILAGGAVEAALFLARGMITPIHFWAVRRFVPLVLPIMALCATYSLYLIGGDKGGRFRHVPGVMLGSVLLVLTVYPFRFFFNHVEYRGAFGQIEALNNKLPANAVLVFEWSDVGGRLPAPLAVLHDRIVFSIDERDIESPGLLHAVRRWTDEGRQVLYLRLGKGPLPPAGSLRLTPSTTAALRLPQAELTTGRLPEKVETLAIDIDIYQLSAVSR